MEIWKDIPGWEGLYQVSNLGRVKSLSKMNGNVWLRESFIMKPKINKTGYLVIHLRHYKKHKYPFVHRLVLLAFKGKSDLQCNHKNGIKTDNRLENLEYCTASQNIKHAFNTGLMENARKRVGKMSSQFKGEKHPNSKLTDNEARIIKYLYTIKKEIGYTNYKIGEMFNISYTIVSSIGLGKLWKHIL